MKLLRRKRNQEPVSAIQLWDDHTERLLSNYWMQSYGR